jgi:hypothetical protein
MLSMIGYGKPEMMNPMNAAAEGMMMALKPLID